MQNPSQQKAKECFLSGLVLVTPQFHFLVNYQGLVVYHWCDVSVTPSVIYGICKSPCVSIVKVILPLSQEITHITIGIKCSFSVTMKNRECTSDDLYKLDIINKTVICTDLLFTPVSVK